MFFVVGFFFFVSFGFVLTFYFCLIGFSLALIFLLLLFLWPLERTSCLLGKEVERIREEFGGGET